MYQSQALVSFSTPIFNRLLFLTNKKTRNEIAMNTFMGEHVDGSLSLDPPSEQPRPLSG